MAAPAHQSRERVRLLLRGPDSFAEDLGGFGEWVGPRLDSLGRSRRDIRKPEGEDWCLRRLLIAWKRAGRLAWPCEIVSYEGLRGDEGFPDYVLNPGEAGRRLGIEVTEATSPEYQARLTGTESAGAGAAGELADAEGWAGDAPERQAIAELLAAIRRKLERAAKGRYQAVPAWDLLLYLNSEVDVLVSPGEIVRRLRDAPWATEIRHRNDGPHQIHIVFGDKVALDVLGESARLVSIETAYEHDFSRWLEEEAKLAQTGCADELDLSNLAEELRSLAAKDRRARDSHVRNLLIHLLKWEYQPERRSRSWAGTIVNARDEIEALVAQSPSLGKRAALEQAIAEQYPRARRGAAAETGLPLDSFPESCPYAFERIFDPDVPSEHDE